MAYDTNEVDEGAIFWQFHFLMKRHDLRNVCISLKSKLLRSQEKGTVASYCEAIKYLLKTYTTEYVFPESYIDMM